MDRHHDSPSTAPSGETSHAAVDITTATAASTAAQPDPAKGKRKGALPKGGRPKKKAAHLAALAEKRRSALRAARGRHGIEADIAESVVARILLDDRGLDAEALTTHRCWVEYRQLSPLARTELFARDYVTAYRTAEANRTGKPADATRPLEPELMLESPDVITALSNARAYADLMGLPYPVFFGEVMSTTSRAKWGGVPRPNQLYGKLVVPLFRGWQRTVSTAARLDSLASNPRFLALNYRGDPDQSEVLALLAELIRAAPDRAQVLASAMNVLGMMPAAYARELFPAEYAAVALPGPSPGPAPVPALPPYRPGCFSYMGQPAEQPCQHCPFAADCRGASAAARAILVARTGTDRVKTARKKKLAAERSKRYRQNLRAKKEAQLAEKRAQLTGAELRLAMIREEQVKIQQVLRENRKHRIERDE